MLFPAFPAASCCKIPCRAGQEDSLFRHWPSWPHCTLLDRRKHGSHLSLAGLIGRCDSRRRRCGVTGFWLRRLLLSAPVTFRGFVFSAKCFTNDREQFTDSPKSARGHQHHFPKRPVCRVDSDYAADPVTEFKATFGASVLSKLFKSSTEIDSRTFFRSSGISCWIRFGKKSTNTPSRNSQICSVSN